MTFERHHRLIRETGIQSFLWSRQEGRRAPHHDAFNKDTAPTGTAVVGFDRNRSPALAGSVRNPNTCSLLVPPKQNPHKQMKHSLPAHEQRPPRHAKPPDREKEPGTSENDTCCTPSPPHTTCLELRHAHLPLFRVPARGREKGPPDPPQMATHTQARHHHPQPRHRTPPPKTPPSRPEGLIPRHTRRWRHRGQGHPAGSERRRVDARTTEAGHVGAAPAGREHRCPPHRAGARTARAKERRTAAATRAPCS